MFTAEEMKKKCQENIWLKVGGVDFEDDPCMELDYGYNLKNCATIEELEKKIGQGNWAIRQGFAYKQLLFVNQVNGGDEWWACYKHEDGCIEDFESITFREIISRGEFKEYIQRLLKGPDVYWDAYSEIIREYVD
ncbi:hypothetical protein [Priestia endophytica]|uniref:Phage protein n=1 Tax=Priestia endophytica DSM 13796 TaxID=1121089 RepID=A0A1I6C7F4_9BACI|nr:hypothetical protein [Priestia endophytica]KYG33484.1 hypothetical protein AZF06_21820 [Priestia endophytica]SFQ89097.1 hypothetical protein SAMN02745910_05200 [Priestia endophytica DSM 13796]